MPWFCFKPFFFWRFWKTLNCSFSAGHRIHLIFEQWLMNLGSPQIKRGESKSRKLTVPKTVTIWPLPNSIQTDKNFVEVIALYILLPVEKAWTNFENLEKQLWREPWQPSLTTMWLWEHQNKFHSTSNWGYYRYFVACFWKVLKLVCYTWFFSKREKL